MKSEKILILLTGSYPFDLQEPFLENEIKYLYESFDKVYIFSTFEKEASLKFNLPSNVFYYRIYKEITFIQKLISFRYLFTSNFFNELSFIRKTLKQKITLKKIFIFIAEFHKAFIFYTSIKKILDKKLFLPHNLYFYSFWSDFKAMSAALLKNKYPFSKAFSRAHRWEVYFEVNHEHYLLGKALINNTLDAIFYVSDDGYNYSRNIYGKLSNLKISRLGTSMKTTPCFNKIRRPFHIVSCSYFNAVKRVDLIVRALNEYCEEYPIVWTHIGEGPLESKIKTLATELLSAKTNIKYSFTGYITNTEVLEFYNKNTLNLFVNVSSSEGVPFTIMEAMSFGIPVAGTDVGGNSEIIDNNINGILMSPDPDPKEITQAIIKYISMDDQSYLLQCKAAHVKWFEKYNAEKNYLCFIDEISKL